MRPRRDLHHVGFAVTSTRQFALVTSLQAQLTREGKSGRVGCYVTYVHRPLPCRLPNWTSAAGEYPTVSKYTANAAANLQVTQPGVALDLNHLGPLTTNAIHDDLNLNFTAQRGDRLLLRTQTDLSDLD